MHYPFVQLDVFAARPGDGNPLAVVFDASSLDEAAMQAIARWTRLPETTFVLPPSTPEGAVLTITCPGGAVFVGFSGGVSAIVGTSTGTVSAGLWIGVGGAAVTVGGSGLGSGSLWKTISMGSSGFTGGVSPLSSNR